MYDGIRQSALSGTKLAITRWAHLKHILRIRSESGSLKRRLCFRKSIPRSPVILGLTQTLGNVKSAKATFEDHRDDQGGWLRMDLRGSRISGLSLINPDWRSNH